MTVRTALVLYGSETGTAQDGAEEIGRMLMRLRFAVQVSAFNEINPTELKIYNIVVCTISTTGQGDIPIGAKSFWKSLLRSKLTSSFLANLNVAVFGFGDSSYAKYNYAGLKLHKRLVQLGAVPVIPMGKGDEQHPEGHESTFLPWMIELREQILQLLPLPEAVEPIPEDLLLEPPWLLTLDTDRNQVNDDEPSSSFVPISIQEVSSPVSINLQVVLEKNQRVTPDSHWQDVRHLNFTSETLANYEPGDVLVIYPHNPEDHVQEILDLMEWNTVADQPLSFTKNVKVPELNTLKSPSFRTPSIQPTTTLRQLLTKHLDINSIPRRSFFSLISHFTTDEYQKTRVLEFSNTEYLDELYDYTTRPRRSILEVLQEFDTVKIPWPWVAVIFPVLRGRQFSIASGGELRSNKTHPTSFELLVAIVKYRTVIRKTRRGVCSRYLESLKPGSILDVSLQKGGLGITEADLSRPIILIGPGTGIAPIRSLLWQKAAWYSKHPTSTAGQCVLFFGGRNKTADFFFEDEWEHLKAILPLEVFPAFSRDQAEKLYVQDLISKHSRQVCHVIEQQGMIFVCGSSGKMPVAVRLAIRAALVKELSISEQRSEELLLTMEKNNRYKQETW